MKRWTKFLFFAALLALPALLASSFGVASDGGHGEAHGGGGIPTAVWLQFLNFGLYVALLVFIGRQPVKQYFGDRRKNFSEALKKAESAKTEAEERRREIQTRLAKLESTREQSILSARAEAAALKEQIVSEAKQMAAKLRADAERTTQVELDRAKAALREELVAQSVVLARKILTDKSKLQEQDQKRLQNEFVEKIQVVSQ